MGANASSTLSIAGSGPRNNLMELRCRHCRHPRSYQGRSEDCQRRSTRRPRRDNPRLRSLYAFRQSVQREETACLRSTGCALLDTLHSRWSCAAVREETSLQVCRHSTALVPRTTCNNAGAQRTCDMDDRSAGWLTRVRDVHAVNGGPSGCCPRAVGARARHFTRCTDRAKHHSGEQESCRCSSSHRHAANRRHALRRVALQPEPQHSANSNTPATGSSPPTASIRTKTQETWQFTHQNGLANDSTRRACQPDVSLLVQLYAYRYLLS